jgi:hypothetical protein
MPKICYKFPTRERAAKFFTCLDNINTLAKHDDFTILATLDIDDPSAITSEFKTRILNYPKVVPIWGISTGKVNAINRDMAFAGEWDILVLLSDDMFLLPGFDLEIIKAFEDGFSGLAHFPDGHVNERLCTFTVMDRKYYDLFGYIYNPIYKSVYCDNEQHDVAVLMKRYKYIPVNIVRHLHPIWGHGQMDDLYRRNEERTMYEQDGKIFQERKANNYGL